MFSNNCLSARCVLVMRTDQVHGSGKGQVKIIDIVSARLDPKTDSYVAELPSLLKDVRIDADKVRSINV